MRSFFNRMSCPVLVSLITGISLLPALAHARTFPVDDAASKELYRRLENDYRGNNVFKNSEMNRYRDGKRSGYIETRDSFKTQSDALSPEVLKILPDGVWISYSLFNQAIRGMRSALKNFPEAGIRSDIVTVVDFGQKNESRRFTVLDLEHERVLFQTWVHHGRKSDGNRDRMPELFSNINDSNKSSPGFIVTDATPYIGQWGYSLRLHGIDGTLNSQMHRRAMVMHPWPNIHPRDIAKLDAVSQASLGCLSLPYYESGKFYGAEDLPLSRLIIDTVKGRSVIFTSTAKVDLEKKSLYLNGTAPLPAAARQTILARLNSETNLSASFAAKEAVGPLPPEYRDWKPHD